MAFFRGKNFYNKIFFCPDGGVFNFFRIFPFFPKRKFFFFNGKGPFFSHIRVVFRAIVKEGVKKILNL